MNRLMYRSVIVLTIGLLLSILAAPASAQISLTNTSLSVLKPFDIVTVTVDATAGGVALTAALINPSKGTATCAADVSDCRAQRAACANFGAKIWVTAQTVRVLSTGTNGLPVVDGASFTVEGFDAISTLKAIRDAGVSSTLICEVSRRP